jgi:hypothetical protein
MNGKEATSKMGLDCLDCKNPTEFFFSKTCSLDITDGMIWDMVPNTFSQSIQIFGK